MLYKMPFESKIKGKIEPDTMALVSGSRLKSAYHGAPQIGAANWLSQ
jgi:hypothetical protein